MKKILRSVIDIGGSIEADALQKNLYTLADADLAFLMDEDHAIWEYVLSYARVYTEAPAINSVRDYFEKEGRLDVLDRLEEIEASQDTYKYSDFENLVRQARLEQNERDTSMLLKDAGHILTNGLSIGRGKNKVDYKGYRDSLRYIMERADKLLTTDTGQVFRSNITGDSERVKKDFQNTLSNLHNAWGRGTGLENIDLMCRGVKPGELWVHSAFVGELKCLQMFSTVYNHSTRKLETIKDLYDRQELPVVTALKDEGKGDPVLVQAQTSHLVENGVRDIYRVTLKSGRTLEITDNHPLWALNEEGLPEWAELKDLREGSWVGTPSIMRVPDPRQDFSDEEVKLVGYMIGDGDCGKHSHLGFANINGEIRHDFCESLESLGYQEGPPSPHHPYYRTNPEGHSHFHEIRIGASTQDSPATSASPLRSLLERLGLWGKGSSDKFIPGEFFGLPDDQIALLLGALWSTDGSCHVGDHKRADRKSKTKRNDITYSTISPKLATGIQGLLLRLGIQSTVRTVNSSYGGEPYQFYTVRVVSNTSKRRFCEEVKVLGKEENFDALYARLRPVDDRKFPAILLKPYGRSRVRPETSNWRYAHHISERFQTVEGHVLREFASKHPELNKHLDGDVTWDQIESIELKGQEMTYDLSVPVHHSFVVNDVITHNTSFALNWAYKTACIFKYNVYYYSLEMPVEQVRRILYVMHSNHPKFRRMGYEPLDYRKIRDGVDSDGNKISQAEIDFFNLVVDDMEQGFASKEYGAIFVECPDEPVTTMTMVKSRIEMVHQTTPIHLVFLDYLGLLSADRRFSDYREELNSIFRSAKQMCLTFNRGERIPIVAMHQMNREGKKDADKNDGRYTAQALADSSAAERTADVITYSYLNDDLRRDQQVKIGCIKNRDNPHFEPFLANIHFPSRFISNITSHTGKIGIGGLLT